MGAPKMLASPRTACSAAARCDLVCPSFCLLLTFAVVAFGCIIWSQGYFIRPGEGSGGCQGEQASFPEKEAEWRAAWTGDCAFLYRNAGESGSGSAKASQTIHGEEYDACYREACRAFCRDRLCQAKVAAIALWCVAIVSGCLTLGCMVMQCRKVANAMRPPPPEQGDANQA
eukprot:CAMPEP_0204579074 /NCGR_PEP_ID=MMETSP0661-20131031/43285_1 /ASSEMBLY_ACC=CAM_ASM_000606 /TAXON_ID=109239 /ORGANISM="Alexandrium margalefi, Strain AMGDE01CS-322" /LENGTH=171 /DNA_ID=CAMNT_0051588047 /DNA_START=97 /DNA_END=612 /DNA_ORIENTATION=+